MGFIKTMKGCPSMCQLRCTYTPLTSPASLTYVSIAGYHQDDQRLHVGFETSPIRFWQVFLLDKGIEGGVLFFCHCCHRHPIL